MGRLLWLRPSCVLWCESGPRRRHHHLSPPRQGRCTVCTLTCFSLPFIVTCIHSWLWYHPVRLISTEVLSRVGYCIDTQLHCYVIYYTTSLLLCRWMCLNNMYWRTWRHWWGWWRWLSPSLCSCWWDPTWASLRLISSSTSRNWTLLPTYWVRCCLEPYTLLYM